MARTKIASHYIISIYNIYVSIVDSRGASYRRYEREMQLLFHYERSVKVRSNQARVGDMYTRYKSKKSYTKRRSCAFLSHTRILMSEHINKT